MSNRVILSVELMVKKIVKKTSANFFKDLKQGDIFKLEYNLNGGYHGAPSIGVYRDGELVIHNNALQLAKNLRNFLFTEVGVEKEVAKDE